METTTQMKDLFTSLKTFFDNLEDQSADQIAESLKNEVNRLHQNGIILGCDIWHPLNDNTSKFIIVPYGLMQCKTIIPTEIHFIVKWDGTPKNPQNINVWYSAKFGGGFGNGTHNLKEWENN